jgi:hypothetical protein
MPAELNHKVDSQLGPDFPAMAACEFGRGGGLF